MEFISSILWFIPFIIVLSIIIFIHELGHYWVARWNNVAISTFSVGFGRELWGRTDKHGTRWRIAMIPLGGYVRFTGDMDLSRAQDPEFIAKTGVDDPSRLFVRKNVWQRIAIVIGGPLANFILTIAILFGLVMALGVSYYPAVVGDVVEGSPAQNAGLEKGDKILAVNNYEVLGFREFTSLVRTHNGHELDLTFERQGQVRTVKIVPETATGEGPTGREITFGRVGVYPAQNLERISIDPSLSQALVFAYKEMVFVVDATFRFIGDLFRGRSDVNQLSGIIGVAEISTEVARERGLIDLIRLTAILSLNIGLFNLFPIPVLDGGHLTFYLFELLRGKPLPAQAQEVAYRVGLVLILGLMVFTFLLDLRLI